MNTVSETTVLFFIRQDKGEVLLFDADGKKFRVPIKGLFQSVSTLRYGQVTLVKSLLVKGVLTKRVMVTNREDVVRRDKPYVHANSKEPILITSKNDSEFFGLPIGTAFYKLKSWEEPFIGDFLVANMFSKEDGYMGVMTDIIPSTDKSIGHVVKVGGAWRSYREIGTYVIKNPSLITKKNNSYDA